MFPKILKVPNKPWITQPTLSLIEQCKAARTSNNPDKETKLDKQVKSSARKDRKAWLHKQLKDSEALGGPLGKELYRNIKRVRSSFHGQKGTLQENGVLQPQPRRNEIIKTT